jgi:hypothetical protein
VFVTSCPTILLESRFKDSFEFDSSPSLEFRNNVSLVNELVFWPKKCLRELSFSGFLSVFSCAIINV